MNEQHKHAQRLGKQTHEETEAQRTADPRFLERMNILIQLCGSASALARAAGVADGTIRKWAAGQSEPTRDRLLALAEAADVNISWLVTGDGPMKSTGAEVVTSPLAKGELAPHYYQVPVLEQWAKGTELPPTLLPQLDFLAIKIDWARRYLTLDVEDLALVTMLDDSMSPTLKDLSVLIVDTVKVKVKSEAIYLVRLSGVFMVRRLTIGPSDSIVVNSDNPLFPQMLIPREQIDSLEIWGKVAWAFQKV